MREIRFRGIAVNSKEMVYSMTISNGTIKRKRDNVFFEIYEKWVGVIPETVGQNTGLKDKNGKEIYEGDIIKCSQYIGTWTVIFKHGCFGLQGNSDASGLSGSINDNFFSFSEALTPDTLKILGNIHDNKELLK